MGAVNAWQGLITKGGRVYVLAGSPSLSEMMSARFVDHQIGALFDALADWGWTHTPLPNDFWGDGLQHVQFPWESLDGSGSAPGGNRLDISLVLASAMESVGMQPVLLMGPQDAFVSVMRSET